MTLRAPGTIALFLAVSGVFAACGDSGASRASREPDAKQDAIFARASAEETRARATAVEARFDVSLRADGVRFEALEDGDAVRAIASEGAAGRKRARVTLPIAAEDMATLADDGVNVTVAFRLVGARAATLSIDDGVARYAGAVATGDGDDAPADLFHRVSAAGTEDYVVYDRAPAREELAYDVDVSGAAGLRFVHDTIEFVDAGGVPRLRIAKPYVIDASKNVHDASLAVDGCRYDRRPAAPQGRPVVPPGASHCTVRVTWSGVTYPALVDPAWSYTHNLVISRTNHASALLPNGQVLLYGGVNVGRLQQNLADADLYDPATDVFSDGGPTPTRAQYPTATTLPSGKVLVVGGEGTGDPQTGFLYDATTGLYTPTGVMEHGRVRHSATLLPSGKVFIGGGHDLSNDPSVPLTTGELFDPAGNGGVGTWRAYPMATREYPQSVLLSDGRVLMTGGEDLAGNPLGTAEIFDPNASGGAGAVVATGSLSHPRAMHTASALAGNRALVAGGVATDFATPLDTVEIFDAAANAGIGAFSVSSVKLLTPRSGHSVTTLQSGELLLVSGSTTGNAPLASTEIFDPKSNGGSGLFVAGPPLQSSRLSHAATLLAMGDVLASGGVTGAPAASLITAERLKLSAAGVACSDEVECLSGSCDNGVCCATPCNGTCERCVPGTGACVKVTSADDDDTCKGASTCSAAGECKGRNAGPCKTASDCASNFCVDGVCCDSACSGQCQACDIALKPGTCGTISGVPHGTRAACESGAVCDGQTFDACTKTGATCATDGHTSVSVSGQQVDCAPYTCTANGTCLTTCSSVGDCAAPYACSFDGACVAPSAPPAGSSGGCPISPARPTSPGPSVPAVALGGLGLIVFFRRRTSGRRRG